MVNFRRPTPLIGRRSAGQPCARLGRIRIKSGSVENYTCKLGAPDKQTRANKRPEDKRNLSAALWWPISYTALHCTALQRTPPLLCTGGD